MQTENGEINQIINRFVVKSFIENQATLEDIEEIKRILAARYAELKIAPLK